MFRFLLSSDWRVNHIITRIYYLLERIYCYSCRSIAMIPLVGNNVNVRSNVKPLAEYTFSFSPPIGLIKFWTFHGPSVKIQEQQAMYGMHQNFFMSRCEKCLQCSTYHRSFCIVFSLNNETYRRRHVTQILKCKSFCTYCLTYECLLL